MRLDGEASVDRAGRDVDTLTMNATNAQSVLAELPDSVARLHLSGIRSEAQVRDVAASRADAALIGECLMREDDPTALLTQLVAAGAGSGST